MPLFLALAAAAAAQVPPSPAQIAGHEGVHAAAHLGNAEVVRRLFAAGAPLDHVDTLGWMAML